ncbi:hypothetical protein FBUS_11445 [Fasciolopsis buskii]|uniref:Uncharacterized protein n=1 Tax=Fasciolopsis buskii TaxID=27845 RepID=A0A8E0VJE1_9TREM|nr:hypothetical protein FBUS_11445 [Fasciolopsis buski]
MLSCSPVSTNLLGPDDIQTAGWRSAVPGQGSYSSNGWDDSIWNPGEPNNRGELITVLKNRNLFSETLAYKASALCEVTDSISGPIQSITQAEKFSSRFPQPLTSLTIFATNEYSCFQEVESRTLIQCAKT